MSRRSVIPLRTQGDLIWAFKYHRRATAGTTLPPRAMPLPVLCPFWCCAPSASQVSTETLKQSTTSGSTHPAQAPQRHTPSCCWHLPLPQTCHFTPPELSRPYALKISPLPSWGRGPWLLTALSLGSDTSSWPAVPCPTEGRHSYPLG